MKAFKEVEATRRQYHAQPAVNSVHRSSLLVPELPGAVAEISFINHFLLKRKYPNVGCRITALASDGRRLESRLFPVTEPRVYTLTLTGMFDAPASDYMVEFFAAENLFIPFPAVMINHRGPGFLNCVHSYNRALNDVFEDDAINSAHQAEASIDILPRPGVEPFLLFTAGPLGCKGELEFELGARAAKLRVDVPRLTHALIKLGEVFPGLEAGVLKVRQPKQPLFYGRMLVGHRDAEGRFSANHSYYDSSGVAEYWDDTRDGYNTYPFIPDLENTIRMYPIMSPGTLSLSVSLRGAGGKLLAEVPVGELASPSANFLQASVNELARMSGVAPASIEAFVLRASCGAGRMPTRVNHQLVYSRGGLEASVNISLINPNVFVPPKKTGLTWGQLPVGRGLRSTLALSVNAPSGPADAVEVVFYGEAGELGKASRPLLPGGCARFNSEDLDPAWAEVASETPRYLWYMARSTRSDLSSFVVTRDLATGHCTGEHGF